MNPSSFPSSLSSSSSPSPFSSSSSSSTPPPVPASSVSPCTLSSSCSRVYADLHSFRLQVSAVSSGLQLLSNTHATQIDALEHKINQLTTTMDTMRAHISAIEAAADAKAREHDNDMKQMKKEWTQWKTDMQHKLQQHSHPHPHPHHSTLSSMPVSSSSHSQLMQQQQQRPPPPPPPPPPLSVPSSSSFPFPSHRLPLSRSMSHASDLSTVRTYSAGGTCEADPSVPGTPLPPSPHSSLAPPPLSTSPSGSSQPSDSWLAALQQRVVESVISRIDTRLVRVEDESDEMDKRLLRMEIKHKRMKKRVKILQTRMEGRRAAPETPATEDAPSPRSTGTQRSHSATEEHLAHVQHQYCPQVHPHRAPSLSQSTSPSIPAMQRSQSTPQTSPLAGPAAGPTESGPLVAAAAAPAAAAIAPSAPTSTSVSASTHSSIPPSSHVPHSSVAPPFRRSPSAAAPPSSRPRSLVIPSSVGVGLLSCHDSSSPIVHLSPRRQYRRAQRVAHCGAFSSDSSDAEELSAGGGGPGNMSEETIRRMRRARRAGGGGDSTIHSLAGGGGTGATGAGTGASGTSGTDLTSPTINKRFDGDTYESRHPPSYRASHTSPSKHPQQHPPVPPHPLTHSLPPRMHTPSISAVATPTFSDLTAIAARSPSTQTALLDRRAAFRAAASGGGDDEEVMGDTDQEQEHDVEREKEISVEELEFGEGCSTAAGEVAGDDPEMEASAAHAGTTTSPSTALSAILLSNLRGYSDRPNQQQHPTNLIQPPPSAPPTRTILPMDKPATGAHKTHPSPMQSSSDARFDASASDSLAATTSALPSTSFPAVPVTPPPSTSPSTIASTPSPSSSWSVCPPPPLTLLRLCRIHLVSPPYKSSAASFLHTLMKDHVKCTPAQLHDLFTYRQLAPDSWQCNIILPAIGSSSSTHAQSDILLPGVTASTRSLAQEAAARAALARMQEMDSYAWYFLVRVPDPYTTTNPTSDLMNFLRVYSGAVGGVGVGGSSGVIGGVVGASGSEVSEEYGQRVTEQGSLLFVCTLRCVGVCLGKGEGGTKTKSKEEAAREALKQLKRAKQEVANQGISWYTRWMRGETDTPNEPGRTTREKEGEQADRGTGTPPRI